MIEIKKDIYWTGIKDWDLRVFHGHELSTRRGSSFNSFLIRDEKTVLVDTVWEPFKEEFVAKLERDVGLENIGAIVINHIEPDHGGSLGYLMERIPNVPIYCTKNGIEIIKKTFQKNWNFNAVKTGDSLKTGKYELVFVEMQMIHWPDSMLTYVKGADLVISNDAFGQHYAAQGMFNDEIDNCELYQEAIKYFANILTPFCPLIKKKIEQISAMNLPIDMIAPSHGVIWRKDPMQIINKYSEWSQEYNEGNAVIIYDTMYNATKNMAESIAQGLTEAGIRCKMFNAANTDESDLLTEIFKAKGVLIGSCTVNNSVLRAIAALLEEIKTHKFKGKTGAGFGSFGWSGEAPKMISQKLADSGFNVIQGPLAFKYMPTPEEYEQCVAFGKAFGESLKA